MCQNVMLSRCHFLLTTTNIPTISCALHAACAVYSLTSLPLPGLCLALAHCRFRSTRALLLSVLTPPAASPPATAVFEPACIHVPPLVLVLTYQPPWMPFFSNVSASRTPFRTLCTRLPSLALEALMTAIATRQQCLLAPSRPRPCQLVLSVCSRVAAHGALSARLRV